MANYPTSLDSLTNPTAGDTLNNPSHSTQHINANDILEALEAKVGIDSSAVTTSLDYKVKSTSSVDPGHKHTVENSLSGVTTSTTELNYVDGVTSAIQTQLNAKEATITTLAVNKGGTGLQTIDDHYVLIGSGTSAVTPITPSDAGKVLTSNGIGVDPSFQAMSVIRKNGTATRILSADDGTVNYAHGLGTIPKNVRITCFFFLNSTSIQVSSYGVYNGATTACMFSGVSTALQNDVSTTKIIHIVDQGVSNSYAEASITVDATNIMLAWTKTNSPTATVKFIWEVES